MRNEERYIYRRKAYVIVGHDPESGLVVGYAGGYADKVLVDYYVPHNYYQNDGGRPYMKRGRKKLYDINQVIWYSMRDTIEWAKFRYPKFEWKAYRANSKYCPIEINRKQIFKFGTGEYRYQLNFKPKKNWDWNKKF